MPWPLNGAQGAFLRCSVYVIKKDGTNQKIWLTVRHEDYTSLSATVISTTGSTLQTATPTVASWTDTLAADAGLGESNPDILTLNNASDVQTGWAFLVDEGGHWTLCEIVSVDTSTNKVYLADNLQIGFSSGATLKPAEASFDVAADVYDTEQKWYVNIYYQRADLGVPYGWKEFGYTTQYPAMCPVSPIDMLHKWPNLLDIDFARNREKFLSTLLSTVFDKVRSKVWDRGYTVEMYKGSVEALKQAILYEAAWVLSESGVNPLEEGGVAEFQSVIAESRSAAWVALDNTDQWIDLDESGSQSEYEFGQGKEYVW